MLFVQVIFEVLDVCSVLGLALLWGWVSEVVWFVMAVGCLGQSVVPFGGCLLMGG